MEALSQVRSPLLAKIGLKCILFSGELVYTPSQMVILRWSSHHPTNYPVWTPVMNLYTCRNFTRESWVCGNQSSTQEPNQWVGPFISHHYAETIDCDWAALVYSIYQVFCSLHDIWIYKTDQWESTRVINVAWPTSCCLIGPSWIQNAEECIPYKYSTVQWWLDRVQLAWGCVWILWLDTCRFEGDLFLVTTIAASVWCWPLYSL